jgi:hypothetical protein
MAKDNLISIVIPPEVITAVTEAINVIVTQLKPYLIALKPEERKKLPKMGDKTMPFVSKVIEYTGTNPEFIPAFLDIAELKNDFNAVSVLNQMFRPLSEVVDNLNDTILTLGSDSYKGSLKYYDSVKMSAKNDVPNAKTVFEDLRKRFEAQGKKAEEENSVAQ